MLLLAPEGAPAAVSALVQAKKHPQGPVEYLRAISPNWRLLGRVTFHLAENKRDENRPFAFLATYAHRLAAGARLQHLPLGQALKEYARAKDQARLALLDEADLGALKTPAVAAVVAKLLNHRPSQPASFGREAGAGALNSRGRRDSRREPLEFPLLSCRAKHPAARLAGERAARA